MTTSLLVDLKLFGYPLEWELPEAQTCRIACYLNDVDPADETDWPRQHEWLAKRLNEMHRVFAQRVKALEADYLMVLRWINSSGWVLC
jgi:hypothetical protein